MSWFKIAKFLSRAGWQVDDKKVERIWRREELIGLHWMRIRFTR